jgi:cyclophilin family peptidyl-prolyl cis-trans isomerase
LLLSLDLKHPFFYAQVCFGKEWPVKKNFIARWVAVTILALSGPVATIYAAEEMMMAFTEPTKSIEFESGKSYLALIHTSKGDITCQLYPDKAPLSVTNFVQLVQGGFYNNLIFHRVVPRFVVQGGDPKGNGLGGPGYTVAAEIGLSHLEGALAWARLPDHINPDKRSSGSQFYITLEKVPHLDGEYTVFGQTVAGMDVVRKIQQGDLIKSIDLIVK